MKKPVVGFRALAVIVCIFISSITAIAQDAIVTFYSRGRNVTGPPGATIGFFGGNIFDGNQRLLAFIRPAFGREALFVTLRFPVGLHTFSAEYGREPSVKDITIDLKAGQNYFFRAYSESKGVIMFVTEHGRLDQVSCEVAQQETKEAKPLMDKNVSDTMTANLIQQSSVPSCK